MLFNTHEIHITLSSRVEWCLFLGGGRDCPGAGEGRAMCCSQNCSVRQMIQGSWMMHLLFNGQGILRKSAQNGSTHVTFQMET